MPILERFAVRAPTIAESVCIDRYRLQVRLVDMGDAVEFTELGELTDAITKQ